MAEHEKFHYRDLSELIAAAEALGLDLRTTDDLSALVLNTPILSAKHRKAAA